MTDLEVLGLVLRFPAVPEQTLNTVYPFPGELLQTNRQIGRSTSLVEQSLLDPQVNATGLLVPENTVVCQAK